jgi:phage tail tube protein FII
MKPEATDWHGVALAKLTKVMGEEAGRGMAQAILEEIGVEQLASPRDLRSFAEALARRGGFASAIGALLALHATIHDGTPQK